MLKSPLCRLCRIRGVALEIEGFLGSLSSTRARKRSKAAETPRIPRSASSCYGSGCLKRSEAPIENPRARSLMCHLRLSIRSISLIWMCKYLFKVLNYIYCYRRTHKTLKVPIFVIQQWCIVHDSELLFNILAFGSWTQMIVQRTKMMARQNSWKTSTYSLFFKSYLKVERGHKEGDWIAHIPDANHAISYDWKFICMVFCLAYLL